MFDIDKWQEIFSALGSNLFRTFMTAFGVSWGIFMLVVMMGAGNGLQNGVMAGFARFATNSAFFWSRSTSMPYKGFDEGRPITLKNGDMEAIRGVEGVELLAPRVNGPWGTEGLNTSRGLKSANFNITGDYPDYFEIDPIDLLEGRVINDIDIRDKRKVCMIGTRVRELLFEPTEEALGQYVRVHGVYFQVIGVFKAATEVNFGSNKEETIFLPFTSLQKAFNYGDQVHYFSFTAGADASISDLEVQIKDLLKQRHGVHPDDERAFGSFNLQERFEQMQGLFLGISLLVWFVGSGTLLAGVIGVSNIMLIIIKERTKEIGIKRALGGTPADVIKQIVTESVFLTTVAGLLGLSFGVALLHAIDVFVLGASGGTQMFRDPSIRLKVALQALAILVGSGALAGLIPARRAVSIKPIDALRDE